tara:strand:- start:1515 stop:1940 length:426 start_codon:yes stop_codon:yes gene_type:complete
MKKVAVDFAITQLETIKVAMENYHFYIKQNHKYKDTKLASIKKIINKIDKTLLDHNVDLQSYTVFRGEGISSTLLTKLKADVQNLFNCQKINLQYHPIFSEKNGHGSHIIVVMDDKTEDIWICDVDANENLEFKKNKCYVQ